MEETVHPLSRDRSFGLVSAIVAAAIPRDTRVLPRNNKNSRLYRGSPSAKETSAGQKACLHILPFFHPLGRIAIAAARCGATRHGGKSWHGAGEKARALGCCSARCYFLSSFFEAFNPIPARRPSSRGPVAKVLSGMAIRGLASP